MQIDKIHLGDAFDLIKQIPDGSVDVVITSPPYSMGKEYESKKRDLSTFIHDQEIMISECYRVLKNGGSLCYQVGMFVKDNAVTPLIYIIFPIVSKHAKKLVLRNEIAWHFGFGLNCKRRFSGRYESILWYTKGNDYQFNDKRDLGDFWEITNVKANHPEKTLHPCQFPKELPERLINALCPKDGIVLDPYMGSGTVAIAAIEEGVHYIGFEKEKAYVDIANERIKHTNCKTGMRHEQTLLTDFK